MVLFSAERWCTDSKKLAPVFRDYEYLPECRGIRFCNVDCDACADIVHRYNIDAVGNYKPLLLDDLLLNC